jgi:WHEP-TRS domain/OB-fold nucleic acid binding domain
VLFKDLLCAIPQPSGLWPLGERSISMYPLQRTCIRNALIKLHLLTVMLVGIKQSLPFASALSSRLPVRFSTPSALQLTNGCLPGRSAWTISSRSASRLLSTLSPSELDQLNEKIKEKGDEIRKLKESGAEKADLSTHITELLNLKAMLPSDEMGEQNGKMDKPAKNESRAKKASLTKEASKQTVVVEELSESELRVNRLAKIEAIRKAGVEPFEYTFQATHSAKQLAMAYDGKLKDGEEDVEADAAVAGRIMTRRVFGKLAFFTMQDETGMIQLQFDTNRLEESFQVCARQGKLLQKMDTCVGLTTFVSTNVCMSSN